MKRLIIGCLLVSLLLACVPTPEEDPVISKVDGSGVSVQVIDPDVLPNEFRHTFTENRVLIDVSAKVEKPDGKKLPSYALAPGAFTEEQVFAFVKALFGDSPIYEPGEPTKAEIYPQLLAALEELEKVKADPGAYEGGTAEYQRAVDELQQAYNDAPDSDSLKPKAMTLAASDIDHTAVCADADKPGQPGTRVFAVYQHQPLYRDQRREQTVSGIDVAGAYGFSGRRDRNGNASCGTIRRG